MKFTKYHKLGAYHWRMYEDKNSKYFRHANRMKIWIKEENTLDIGAGDGLITALLNIWGIDDEPEAVMLARKKGANVILGDAYALPYKDGQFDSVFMGDVLEHMQYPDLVLKEARRVLSKHLYIASPIPEGKDKFHYYEWNEEELKELVTREGFRLLELFTVKEDKRIYAKFIKI